MRKVFPAWGNLTWVTFADMDSLDGTKLHRASKRKTRESEQQAKIF